MINDRLLRNAESPTTMIRSTSNVLMFAGLACLANGFRVLPIAAQIPETPRIDSVGMVTPQPHENDANVIWFDDFDQEEKQNQYGEKRGATTHEVYLGDAGKSLLMRYPKGGKGIGGRSLFFGDSPAYSAKAVRRGETFTDIYWRVYVKHPHDWKGGGAAKLSRATSLVSANWKQAMIAHVWSSREALTLDPASGVRGDQIVTTKYNDFENLRWLGNKPVSKFQLHSSREVGRWVCVESRAKLNTPGKSDGLNQLWIDGRLELERKNLNWRGSYDGHGVNAVFLEAYWNNGSPVEQSRWIDNFVVSTKPIGPVICPGNPILIKTPYRGPGKLESWEVEIATDESGDSVVWKSKQLGEAKSVKVASETGTFVGESEGQTELESSSKFFIQVRQQNDSGAWSAWSPWHQSFQTID